MRYQVIIFLIGLFTFKTYGYYPLQPMGNINSIQGNVGLAEEKSNSAAAYNPASLVGISRDNVSVGTSFIGLTSFNLNNSGSAKFSERSAKPDFTLGTAFLGAYFSQDNFNYGFFVYNNYNYTVKKAYTLVDANFNGDVQLDINLNSTRIGAIIAHEISDFFHFGFEVFTDLSSEDTTTVSKYRVAVNSSNVVDYSIINSKTQTLGARLGISYFRNENTVVSFIYEPTSIQIYQNQVKNAMKISTDGTSTDSSDSQKSTRTMPESMGIGFKNRFGTNWTVLLDIKKSSKQEISNSYNNQEIPEINTFGIGAQYLLNDRYKLLFGWSSMNVNSDKSKSSDGSSKNTDSSDHISYISSGVSQRYKFLTNSYGLYYSKYYTSNDKTQDQKTNIDSYGIIFNTSYDF